MDALSDEREALLSDLQGDAFKYFVNEINPVNGLIVDCTKEGWPSSIAAVGMAIAAYPVGVEHNFITREEAIEQTLKTLRFFSNSEQSTSVDATGYKGCYYHFLDMQNGPARVAVRTVHHRHDISISRDARSSFLFRSRFRRRK